MVSRKVTFLSYFVAEKYIGKVAESSLQEYAIFGLKTLFLINYAD